MNQPIYVNGRFLSQPLSGVQRFATELTSALAQCYPSRLVVLAPPDAGPAGFPVRTVGRRGGQYWEQVELPRHARDGLLLNLGNTAPLRTGSQMVVIHDAGVYATPEAYGLGFRAWYKLSQAWLSRSGAMIVTVSNTAQRELAQRHGLATDRIGVVSEGADHMRSIVADETILASLPQGRFVLVVGNLAAHKNLAALSVLDASLRRQGITLVITGGLQGMAFAAAEASLPRCAHYTGRVSDACLKALYQRAACLVLPSRYEGFGLPAVEAMACGCPVMASRIPALLETCGEAALYFDPADPADICARVSDLLANPLLADSVRRLGTARADFLTWHRAAALMAGIIDSYPRPQAAPRWLRPAPGRARMSEV